jgi:hypothetical protein
MYYIYIVKVYIQSVSNIFVLANAAGDQSGRRLAPVEAVIVIISDSPPSRLGISLSLA